MHRATINFDDELWPQLRKLAFDLNMPISRLINAMVRRHFEYAAFKEGELERVSDLTEAAIEEPK